VSGDQGAILVSFGSVLGELDGIVVATVAAVFSNLPQRVVWKLDTKGKSSTIGSNVKVSSWLPQNDVLGYLKSRTTRVTGLPLLEFPSPSDFTLELLYNKPLTG